MDQDTDSVGFLHS